MADDGPVVIQRRLRAEIRRLRETAQLTQKEVAARLEWSPSKIIRIESGATNIGVTDLRVLLMLYGLVDEGRVEDLISMARASRRRTWRDQYRPHIDPQFFAFLGYEASAVGIRQLHSARIPGLLQTPDYVRSLSGAFLHDPEKLARGMSIRADRQQILDLQDGPGMTFLLDEGVLWRRVGTWDIMRDQLGRIRDLASRPNIDVRILPFDSDAYRGMGGSFVIFDLSENEQDRVVFNEEFLRDVMIHEDAEEIGIYWQIFGEAESRALPAKDSIKVLDRRIAEM